MPVIAAGKNARVTASQLPYPPPPGQQTPPGDFWNTILEPITLHDPLGMLFSSWSLSSSVEMIERTNGQSYGKQYLPCYKDATLSLEGFVSYDYKTGFYLGELVQVQLLMIGAPELGLPHYNFSIPITITKIDRGASPSTAYTLTIEGVVNYIFDRKQFPSFVLQTLGRGFIPLSPMAGILPTLS